MMHEIASIGGFLVFKILGDHKNDEGAKLGVSWPCIKESLP